MPVCAACFLRQLQMLKGLAVHACSKVVRKSIARLLTVISQQQRAALRDVFKGKVSLFTVAS